MEKLWVGAHDSRPLMRENNSCWWCNVTLCPSIVSLVWYSCVRFSLGSVIQQTVCIPWYLSRTWLLSPFSLQQCLSEILYTFVAQQNASATTIRPLSSSVAMAYSGSTDPAPLQKSSMIGFTEIDFTGDSKTGDSKILVQGACNSENYQKVRVRGSKDAEQQDQRSGTTEHIGREWV